MYELIYRKKNLKGIYEDENVSVFETFQLGIEPSGNFELQVFWCTKLDNRLHNWTVYFDLDRKRVRLNKELWEDEIFEEDRSEEESDFLIDHFPVEYFPSQYGLKWELYSSDADMDSYYYLFQEKLKET